MDIFQEKCLTSSPGTTFCATCAVKMDMDISQRPVCVEICRKSAGRVARARHFVRACAIEMHMDISQEPFCVEIYRENAGRAGYHLN